MFDCRNFKPSNHGCVANCLITIAPRGRSLRRTEMRATRSSREIALQT